MTTSRLLTHWLPVGLWMGLIWWLSSQPDLSSGLQQDFLLRKIAHILEYMILTGLLYRAFRAHLATPAALWAAASVAVVYAMTDEWHQSWVQGRHGTLVDVFIDSSGVLLALVIAQFKKQKTGLS